MSTSSYNIKINDEEFSFANISSFISYCFKNDLKSIQSADEKFVSLYSFLNYYKKIKALCEKEIDCLNENLVTSEKNQIVKEALNKFKYLNSNGKFLRATLVALGYQMVKTDDDYLSLALALEVFQTSILIHDDIIDKAIKRRGKDTIPVMYSKDYMVVDTFKEKQNNFANSMALCIGDLGFYLSSDLLLNNYKDNPNLLDVFRYYNDIAIKTTKGELLDVYLAFKEECFEHSNDLADKIFDIYTLKTAWYSVVGPFCLGLVLAGANDKLIKSSEDILLDVGIAFQIKDDLLGIYGDENKTGKTASDVEEYKQTLLYSYTMNTSYKNELLKYYGTNNIAKVQELFELSGARKYATDKMNDLFDKAIKKLKALDIVESKKSVLIGFVSFLRERDK